MTAALDSALEATQLRPAWLRPTAAGAGLAAHIAVAGLFLAIEEPQQSAFDSYDVSLVQEGEATPQAQTESTPDEQVEHAEATVSQAAAEAQQEEAPRLKQLASDTPLALEKPLIVAPDAIALAQVEKRLNDPEKPTLKPKIEKTKVKQEATPDEATPDKVGLVRRTAQAAAEASEAAAAAERAGAAEGRNAASSASKARYGAKVLTEIHRHMFYPRGARAAGATGWAVVIFTIGAEGRIIERKIERSAGSEELDRAALAMLDAVNAPPPPAGRFFGKTTIKFDIKR